MLPDLSTLDLKMQPIDEPRYKKQRWGKWTSVIDFLKTSTGQWFAIDGFVSQEDAVKARNDIRATARHHGFFVFGVIHQIESGWRVCLRKKGYSEW